MSGINNPLNWDLVRRQTYNATPIINNSFIPIPPIAIISESRFMMFGFRNDLGKSKWKYAARLDMKLLTLPSSTSEFMASVAAYSRACYLRELTLIRFPDFGVNPFLVEIRIPEWHRQMYVEVWKYSGDESDESIAALNRIEMKLDSLP